MNRLIISNLFLVTFFFATLGAHQESSTQDMVALIKKVEAYNPPQRLLIRNLSHFKKEIIEAFTHAQEQLQKKRDDNEDVYYHSIAFLSLIPPLFCEIDWIIVLEEWLDEYEKGVFKGKSIDKEALLPVAKVIALVLPWKWKIGKRFPGVYVNKSMKSLFFLGLFIVLPAKGCVIVSVRLMEYFLS